MRTLVLCCDGTWNSADQATDGVPTPTNVRMFHNALADTDGAGRAQVVRYFSGVGTAGSALQRAIDGGTGHGLSHNIMNAYRWLAGTWTDGDRVVAVGFSRGAYTVRSMVGMLGSCGLVRGRHGTREPSWSDVTRVYAGYRTTPADREPGWADGLVFHRGLEPPDDADPDRRPAAIVEFLGVWDTVGGLGVPDSLGLLDLFDAPGNHGFLDTRAPAGVAHLRHAVALDERRGPFAPTLWSVGGDGAGQDVVQRWFPGAHSDVGGGYRETGLSDGALAWMIGEAQGAGLAFRPGVLAALAPDPCGVLHDSCTGVYQRLAPVPRAVPRIDAGSHEVDPSAVTRRDALLLRQDAYRPERALGTEPVAVDVRAHLPWNETGLWLGRGVYRFRATGEWIDKDTATGPGGVTDADVVARIAYGIGELLGQAETWWRDHTGRGGAEFLGTRRVEDAPWMALVGVVANGGGDPEGGPSPHQSVIIGAGPVEVRVEAPGYLYAFANDAWGFYDNNRGTVTLTVERLS